MAEKVDINGTNFFDAAKGAGYGGSSMSAMLQGTKVPEGKVAHFVELHIEQVPQTDDGSGLNPQATGPYIIWQSHVCFGSSALQHDRRW